MSQVTTNQSDSGATSSRRALGDVVIMALRERWDVEEDAARRFVRRHQNLYAEDLIGFMEELEMHLARMHHARFGHEAVPEVLRRAVVYGLDYLISSRVGLSEKQLADFIQYANDEVASERTRASDTGTQNTVHPKNVI